MPNYEQDIFKRIQFEDTRIHLDYGVPQPDIPYQQVSELIDDSTDTDGVMAKAYDLVEQLKANGQPGAFVTLEYDDDFNTVVRVWGSKTD